MITLETVVWVVSATAVIATILRMSGASVKQIVGWVAVFAVVAPLFPLLFRDPSPGTVTCVAVGVLVVGLVIGVVAGLYGARGSSTRCWRDFGS